MNTFAHLPEYFSGYGEIAGRSWWRGEHDEVPYVAPDERRGALPAGHPADYAAGDEDDTLLAEAVNTALLLRKPLVVTGKPGTGKTELAERIAYEFDLGPVLRFDAQSTSEANDLFYRFDYMAKLVASKLIEHGDARPAQACVLPFVQWGPLGRAILLSKPELLPRLREIDSRRLPLPVARTGTEDTVQAPAETTAPRRSVVLIDEIDKASRDFPNDLLNGIDRMEFLLRELDSTPVRGVDRDSPLHPIVIVTSNSERDLPQPFLRRCVFVQIPDPKPRQLAAIVQRRVFGAVPAAMSNGSGLPPLYQQLIEVFCRIRERPDLRHPSGTAELLDTARAAHRIGIDGNATLQDEALPLRSVLSATAKHPEDRAKFEEALKAAKPAPP